MVERRDEWMRLERRSKSVVEVEEKNNTQSSFLCWTSTLDFDYSFSAPVIAQLCKGDRRRFVTEFMDESHGVKVRKNGVNLPPLVTPQAFKR